MALVVALVVLAILASQVKIWYNYFGLIQQAVKVINSLNIKPLMKIFIATGQIISGFGKILKIDMPDIFSDFTDSFLNAFRFDFTAQVAIGCFGKGSFTRGLYANVVFILVVVALVFLLYLVETYQANRRVDPEDEEMVEKLQAMYAKIDGDGDGVELEEIRALVNKIDPDITDEQITTLFSAADKDGSGAINFDEFLAAVQTPSDNGVDFSTVIVKARQAQITADAIGRVFLLVFLLYPGVTNKILEAFACRDLGPSGGGPGGAPEVTISVLQADYTIDCNSAEYTSLWYFASTLVIVWPIGVPVVLFFMMFRARKAIVAEDEDALILWDFVLSDYHTTHWYWEIVELSRKLILAGLIGLVGSGSIAQVRKTPTWPRSWANFSLL